MVALQLGGVVDHAGFTARDPDSAGGAASPTKRDPAAARGTRAAEHPHHPGVGPAVDDDRTVPRDGRNDRIAQDPGQRLPNLRPCPPPRRPSGAPGAATARPARPPRPGPRLLHDTAAREPSPRPRAHPASPLAIGPPGHVGGELADPAGADVPVGHGTTAATACNEGTGRAAPRSGPGRKSLPPAPLPLLPSKCTSTAHPRARRPHIGDEEQRRDDHDGTEGRPTADDGRVAGLRRGPLAGRHRRSRLHPAQLHPLHRRRRLPRRPDAAHHGDLGQADGDVPGRARARRLRHRHAHPGARSRRTHPATSTRTTS